MPSRLNELTVAEMEDQFRDLNQTGCVLLAYTGMKAAEARQVRHSIARAGGQMTVVRNRLFAVALRRLGVEKLSAAIGAPTSVVQAGDPVSAAKAAREACKLCPALKVYAGYAEGRVLDAAAVEKLADMPSREQLLAVIAGSLMAPLRRLAFALTAKPRALANGLDQLSKRTEEQQAGQ